MQVNSFSLKYLLALINFSTCNLSFSVYFILGVVLNIVVEVLLKAAMPMYSTLLIIPVGVLTYSFIRPNPLAL